METTRKLSKKISSLVSSSISSLFPSRNNSMVIDEEFEKFMNESECIEMIFEDTIKRNTNEGKLDENGNFNKNIAYEYANNTTHDIYANNITHDIYANNITHDICANNTTHDSTYNSILNNTNLLKNVEEDNRKLKMYIETITIDLQIANERCEAFKLLAHEKIYEIEAKNKELNKKIRMMEELIKDKTHMISELAKYCKYLIKK